MILLEYICTGCGKIEEFKLPEIAPNIYNMPVLYHQCSKNTETRRMDCREKASKSTEKSEVTLFPRVAEVVDEDPSRLRSGPYGSGQDVI